MRGLLLTALALALVVGAFGGCANSADSAASSPIPSGGSGGSGGQGDGGQAGEGPTALEFEAGSSELMPREELSLVVTVTPPGVFKVRFALPAGDGREPLDAVLSASEVETDEAGRAEVRLTAPSASTTFRVRASVAGVVGSRDLVVVDRGAVDVLVEPVYAGHRSVLTWNAWAFPGQTCTDALSSATDSALAAEPVGRDEQPSILDVPAGSSFAIVLRSGHFVSGCTLVDGLPASPSSTVVQVTVLDKPIELTQSTLSITFDLARPEVAWSDLLFGSIASVQLALLGESKDDAGALLDAMRAALDEEARPSLDATREAEAWDALVRAHWGVSASSRLRDVALGWLSRGKASFEAAPHLFEGSLAPVDTRSAELDLTLMAGISSRLAGLSSPALVAWSADADDNLVLGTTLYFSASRLVTGLAEAAALADHPQAATPGNALALELDCEGLATTLAGAGADAELAFEDCNEACLSQLCSSATTSLWKRGRDASSTKPVELSLTATGEAEVGDAAELSALSGAWVGQWPGASATKAKISTGGALRALESNEATANQ